MNYPLFLNYKGAVIGNGFIADISALGRLLATVEEEGTWLYGVNPGAVAADGRSIDDAHAAVRETIRLVFVDIAQEAQSFAEFKQRAEAFFNETDEESVAEWTAAVEEIRASKGAALNLPQQPAETMPFISVQHKATEELTPAMNVPAMNFPIPTPGSAPLLSRAA